MYRTKEGRMQQDNNRYAVCYIDKFSDPEKSLTTTNGIATQFKLNSNHRSALRSGNPIIIKKSTPIDVATRLKNAISSLGGCCWIQQLDSAGEFRERRQSDRRQKIDRRSVSRNNIEPDRRDLKNRRKLYLE